MFGAIKKSLLIGVLLSAGMAEARVFSFGDETMAPYIGLRGGQSSLGRKPYEWQSASSYTGDEADLIYGGEFGIYFRGSTLGVGAGVVISTFDDISAGQGFNAGSTQLYTAQIEGLSYGPVLNFDIHFAEMGTSVWKVLIGGGYQFSEMEAQYSFTATGQPLVGGQVSLSEKYRNESLFATVGVGTEFLMSGTTTMQLMLGYHYNFNQEWSYDGGGQNLAGAHNSGDTVIFENGSAKKMDFSYPFLQLNFYFYVDTVR